MTCLLNEKPEKTRKKVEFIDRKKFPVFSYDDIQKMLTQEFYGTTDLLQMKLFNRREEIYHEINNKFLDVQRVNCSGDVKSHVLFIKRDDIINYWKQHRKAQSCEITFACTQQEKNFLENLILRADKKIDHELLFRSLILALHKMPSEKFQLFVKTILEE